MVTKRVWGRFTFWHGTQAYPIDCAPAASSYDFCKGRVTFADFRFRRCPTFCRVYYIFLFQNSEDDMRAGLYNPMPPGLINVGCEAKVF